MLFPYTASANNAAQIHQCWEKETSILLCMTINHKVKQTRLQTLIFVWETSIKTPYNSGVIVKNAHLIAVEVAWKFAT